MEWLDLSRSLMSSWKNVAEICEQLEKLERLVLRFESVCVFVCCVCRNMSITGHLRFLLLVFSGLLSFNRLSLTSDTLVHCQAFCRLKVLSLISCDLTWPQVKHKHTHAPYPHPDDHKQLSYNSYPNSKLTLILFLTLN